MAQVVNDVRGPFKCIHGVRSSVLSQRKPASPPPTCAITARRMNCDLSSCELAGTKSAAASPPLLPLPLEGGGLSPSSSYTSHTVYTSQLHGDMGEMRRRVRWSSAVGRGEGWCESESKCLREGGACVRMCEYVCVQTQDSGHRLPGRSISGEGGGGNRAPWGPVGWGGRWRYLNWDVDSEDFVRAGLPETETCLSSVMVDLASGVAPPVHEKNMAG